jgi:N-terminal 7TM region of histidine kinase
MYNFLLVGLQTLNQLLTAAIAITAFSLLLYALAFNLRDRVARSFALILVCVVIVFVGDAIGSVTNRLEDLTFWLRIEWIGIVFLPPAYLHFSDAVLTTTGNPWRLRRRMVIQLAYLISLGFLITLPFSWLVGPLLPDAEPAPHLQRTALTLVFTLYYIAAMVWTWVNFWNANQRTVTPTGKRRMRYLLMGALAPALGSYPYLLFGSGIASHYPLLFWLIAVLSNAFVLILIVVMAYAVAFFGISWPDRVVKRRLFKWLMRGPVTASLVLAFTTVFKRLGERYDFPYSEALPILMVGSILILEYLITLVAPMWERWLFSSGDQAHMQLLQTAEERLLTTNDLRQFLESLLAAVCDQLQKSGAFVAALGQDGVDLWVTTGGTVRVSDQLLQEFLRDADLEHDGEDLYPWGNYWLVTLYDSRQKGQLVGILGVLRAPDDELDDDQQDALSRLARRAALALADRHRQQQIFATLQDLTPQIDLIQRMRAASRYDGAGILSAPEALTEDETLSKSVKEALTHYWGGPWLTDSPLLRLQVVQQILSEHEDNPSNALRAILREAIDHVRPEGERRYTSEWILYNILMMKYMEGHKMREIAQRLAMSEADLYRKQRVAIDAVASAIREMEQTIRNES